MANQIVNFGSNKKKVTLVFGVEEDSEKLKIREKTRDFNYGEDMTILHPVWVKRRFSHSQWRTIKKCTGTASRAESGASFILLIEISSY